MCRRIILTFSISLLLAAQSFSNVRLPKLFTDSMVLQRDKPIPIWGWADGDEKITVQFHGQTKTVKAGPDGRWKLSLTNEKAGGPYQLIISGKNKIALNNILVGDVWICSGQSNMEWPLSRANDAEKEIQSANYPQIRHVYIPKDVDGKPVDDLKQTTSWKAATSYNAGSFTAVGYFFAKQLHNELHIPIGLIHTSWGGTDVETWISREGFEGSEEFKSMIKSIPDLDIEALANKRKVELNQKIKEVQGGLPDKASVSLWKDKGFDDSKWPAMKVPGLWEKESLNDFDGVVWLRKKINLSADEAKKTALLELGMIDDSDETFVNGIKVGSTFNQYSEKRAYSIPVGVLVAGENVIAVKVTDTGGGGGIYGEPSEVKITASNKVQSLAGYWKYSIEAVQEGLTSVGPNTSPCLLYNAMIHPLIPFAIKGAIWYQGENNAGRAYQYRQSFPLMINDWRKHWGQGDFPFYFVQLASFNAGNGNSNKGSTWAELREAQTMTLSLPNTGMAVTTDIGESKDIHPRNKKDVGVRLAAAALNKTYGKNIIARGPVYKNFKVNGSKAEVFFSNIGTGLYVKDNSTNIKGFEIAGKDQKFYEAKALLEGDHIILSAENVTEPVAVRYAWTDDAGDANLYNKENFPAEPFRTDQWKGITEGNTYR